MIVMPTWEIVGLVILGITLFILAIRVGLVGVFFDILGAIFSGSSSSSGGSSSGGSGFGGGSSGGGGSSSDW